MSLITYKIIAGILIFITSIVAVIYPVKQRISPSHHSPLELGDAYASGIFLGAALFHMLPDANRDFLQIYGQLNYPLAELFCAGGFLILLFLERLSGNSSRIHHTHTVPYTLAFIIIIHSLIEGAVLGINTTLATALIIFIAIIAHKGSESFALAVILNRSELPLKRVIGVILLFSIMTPLGIIFGTTLASFSHFSKGLLIGAAFNAFAAGTFLYMSTLHHINHHQREHEGEGMLEFVFLLLGLITMAVLAWWA